MKISWSLASAKHLEQIDEFLHGESPAGATAMRRRILHTVRRIGQMPLSGKIGRINGTREAVVPRSPFIVAYEISEEGIRILGVWHAARLWPEAF